MVIPAGPYALYYSCQGGNFVTTSEVSTSSRFPRLVDDFNTFEHVSVPVLLVLLRVVPTLPLTAAED